MCVARGSYPILPLPRNPTPILTQTIDTTMDKNKTETTLVIDKSGSMSGLQDTVIASINGFLKDQRNCEGSACVTLLLIRR